MSFTRVLGRHPIHRLFFRLGERLRQSLRRSRWLIRLLRAKMTYHIILRYLYRCIAHRSVRVAPRA